MYAWLNLFKKEYRANRTFLIVMLGILVIGGLWLMYLSNRYSVGIIMAPSALLASFAMFIPGIYMIQSITRELKHTPNLWLHCPQPAWMLLTAKLVMGLIMMAIIIVLDAAFIFWALLVLEIPSPIYIKTKDLIMFVTEVGTYIALAITAASIYIASWTTLIAVATAAARNVLGRFKWLVGVAIFIISTWGMGNLQETAFLHKLTDWGLFTIHIRTLTNFVPAQNPFEGIPIYTGQIIFGIIITIAIYGISTWLLDNKVEV